MGFCSSSGRFESSSSLFHGLGINFEVNFSNEEVKRYFQRISDFNGHFDSGPYFISFISSISISVDTDELTDISLRALSFFF